MHRQAAQNTRRKLHHIQTNLLQTSTASSETHTGHPHSDLGLARSPRTKQALSNGRFRRHHTCTLHRRLGTYDEPKTAIHPCSTSTTVAVAVEATDSPMHAGNTTTKDTTTNRTKTMKRSRKPRTSAVRDPPLAAAAARAASSWWDIPSLSSSRDLNEPPRNHPTHLARVHETQPRLGHKRRSYLRCFVCAGIFRARFFLSEMIVPWHNFRHDRVEKETRGRVASRTQTINGARSMPYRSIPRIQRKRWCAMRREEERAGRGCRFTPRSGCWVLAR